MDVERHHAVARGRRLRIAVTGASGFIGGELVAFLRSGGHEVLPIVRRTPREAEIGWDPRAGTIESHKLEGVDAVVHLAAESVASHRWSEAHKGRILSSRVEGTQLLARALASLRSKPAVWLSASAVGYYGERRDEPVDETADPGDDFLARVCQQWEAATEPASDSGIRVVHPRLGLVLGARGGPLPELMMPFSFGVGGRLGSGRQSVPWIAIDDVVGAFHHLLFHPTLDGPVNLAAPGIITNAELADALGRVMRRPAWLPAPGLALRVLLGEFARQILGGQRPVSATLEQSGFVFRFPDIEKVLRFELGRV